MGLGLPLGRQASGDAPDEWHEVPIYRAIKRAAEPGVKQAFDIETVGLDNVPAEGGLVLASNHASYFDPVFLGAVTPRPIRWMAKSGLFRHPLTSFFFSRAGPVKIDRVAGGNTNAVATCVRIVGEGRVVGVFPEGSRSMDGRLRKGRTGVARVALAADVPVVPVALTSHEVLPKHARVPNLDAPLVIAFGEAMTFPGLEGLAEDRKVCRKVTDEVMDAIGRELERARTKRHALSLERGD